eukprot:2284611-Amphidinium_carterae.1
MLLHLHLRRDSPHGVSAHRCRRPSGCDKVVKPQRTKRDPAQHCKMRVHAASLFKMWQRNLGKRESQLVAHSLPEIVTSSLHDARPTCTAATEGDGAQHLAKKNDP